MATFADYPKRARIEKTLAGQSSRVSENLPKSRRRSQWTRNHCRQRSRGTSTKACCVATFHLAAIASGALEEDGVTGLIVDVGGGTSDFSLFRSGRDGVTILANHGLRIGGTDFDRAISIDLVMPQLGKGTELRKTLGSGSTPTPNAIYNDLATWEKIAFLYTRQNRRMAGCSLLQRGLHGSRGRAGHRRK